MKSNTIKIEFSSPEDMAAFRKYYDKAKATEGTVGGLSSGLMCSAVKRAELIDPTYNGWTNYETWNTRLWMLDNDKMTADMFYTMAREHFAKHGKASPWLLADQIKLAHENKVEHMCLPHGFVYDLVNRTLACRINWRELAESLIESIEND